ncbi:MAG: hypothetical protein IPM29_17240 [Planctomycetes bacterium]|nr:hypothetical protein [Planctomycetota bacterium]
MLLSGDEIWLHVYDGWQEIEELQVDQAGSKSPTKQLVWGERLDELVAYRSYGVLPGGGMGWQSYHATQLGHESVTRLVDANGDVVEQSVYDPFGTPSVYGPNESYLGASSSVGLPFQWKGHRVDPETGLVYIRLRHYSYEWGRFVSIDRLGVWGDAVTLGNGYSYGRHEPMSGRDPIAEGWFIGALIGAAAGAIGGFVSGTVSALREGKSWGEAVHRGGRDAAIGAIAGAVAGATLGLLTTESVGAFAGLTATEAFVGSVAVDVAVATPTAIVAVTVRSRLDSTPDEVRNREIIGEALGAVPGAVGGELLGASLRCVRRGLTPLTPPVPGSRTGAAGGIAAEPPRRITGSVEVSTDGVKLEVHEGPAVPTDLPGAGDTEVGAMIEVGPSSVKVTVGVQGVR